MKEQMESDSIDISQINNFLDGLKSSLPVALRSGASFCPTPKSERSTLSLQISATFRATSRLDQGLQWTLVGVDSSIASQELTSNT